MMAPTALFTALLKLEISTKLVSGNIKFMPSLDPILNCIQMWGEFVCSQTSKLGDANILKRSFSSNELGYRTSPKFCVTCWTI